MLGQIFTKAQNKIQDPAKLYRLIDMVDDTSWVTLGADVKGDIYEGLLERNAEDTKSGAGQYFTPRPLIRAMVECVRPRPGKTIADPACGTGGFFLGAYAWLTREGATLDKKQKAFLHRETFFGNEIVAATRRSGPALRWSSPIGLDAERGDAGDVTGAQWRLTPVDNPPVVRSLVGVDVLVWVAASTDLQSALALPAAQRRERIVRVAQTLVTAAAAAGVQRLIVVTSAMGYGARRDNPVPQPLADRQPFRFGVNKGQVAVLARTNRQLLTIERKFIDSRVPYLRAGRSLWDDQILPQVFVSLLQSLHARNGVGIEVASEAAKLPTGAPPTEARARYPPHASAPLPAAVKPGRDVRCITNPYAAATTGTTHQARRTVPNAIPIASINRRRMAMFSALPG